MLYPAKFDLNPDTGCYVVSFRDLPEALTQGYSLDEARTQAKDALIDALDFYFEDERPVPPPSELQEGEEIVEIPLSVWSKVLLLNTMLEQRVSQAELGKMLNKPRQEINRMTNLSHATKIDSIVEALKALGKQPHLVI
ncbi:type II toxin-antitoxin system HicB family antitoxin [Acinetobacter courvalinii]|uniref:type II toxin-antitoxin system HicB family antitoxin n=1 Tax=Acinetobacter courvalinii TaxID=280147 RepID=UPI0021D3AE58|nr:type II toxin-antitoxin system HicB family antitoxin [Acinetobacter courvalinii]MCU4576113.1 type II toxin-antitoxin system HicB family antitoxin [Acinetobacter courvalinii]